MLNLKLAKILVLTRIKKHMDNRANVVNSHDAIEQLKQNSNWYLALGISLTLLGFLAIAYAALATIFSVIWFGALLISIGVFQIIKCFKICKWGNFLIQIILSSIYIAAGAFIIFYPAVNALSLTLLLAIFFFISGIFKIFFAISRELPHKGWLIFNGVLTALIGFLIWQQWPYSGLWAIGILVGIDAIFTGFTWTVLALRAKELNK